MFTTVKESYPELSDIQSDIDSLKKDTVELARHVKQSGEVQAQELKTYLLQKAKTLQAKAKNELKSLENKVQEKPAQTLTITFLGGMLASILLGRR